MKTTFTHRPYQGVEIDHKTHNIYAATHGEFIACAKQYAQSTGRKIINGKGSRGPYYHPHVSIVPMDVTTCQHPKAEKYDWHKPECSCPMCSRQSI